MSESEPSVSPAATIRRGIWRADTPFPPDYSADEYQAAALAALDVLLAVGERDKAEIAELEAEVVRLRDRAVCSGCGSDVGESGVCPYPGCDDGEMIPASDLPSALRALCDRLTEGWKEWRAETAEDAAERVRDRRQIAQLTEALAEICRPQYELRRDRVDIARAALKAVGVDPAAVLADEGDGSEAFAGTLMDGLEDEPAGDEDAPQVPQFGGAVLPPPIGLNTLASGEEDAD